MTFVDGARAQMIDHLVAHTRKTSVEVRAELQGMRVDDLAIRYFNWILRLIPPQPRRIYVAPSVYASPVLSDLGSEFAGIVGKIEKGEDVNGYLSEGAKTIAFSKASRSDSFDKDGLLNHWGIHHLHFHTITDKVGRKKVGRGRLIFIVIRPEDAYIVAIGDHGSFADRDLVATVRREWPELGLVQPLKGVIGVSRDYDPAELVKLRKAGVTAITMIDGQACMTGAITSAGTSDEAGRRASRFLRCLHWLEQWCVTHEMTIRNHIDKAGRQQPAQLNLTVAIEWDRIVLIEKSSAVALRFPDM